MLENDTFDGIIWSVSSSLMESCNYCLLLIDDNDVGDDEHGLWLWCYECACRMFRAKLCVTDFWHGAEDRWVRRGGRIMKESMKLGDNDRKIGKWVGKCCWEAKYLDWHCTRLILGFVWLWGYKISFAYIYVVFCLRHLQMFSWDPYLFDCCRGFYDICTVPYLHGNGLCHQADSVCSQE